MAFGKGMTVKDLTNLHSIRQTTSQNSQIEYLLYNSYGQLMEHTVLAIYNIEIN